MISVKELNKECQCSNAKVKRMMKIIDLLLAIDIIVMVNQN